MAERPDLDDGGLKVTAVLAIVAPVIAAPVVLPLAAYAVIMETAMLALALAVLAASLGLIFALLTVLRRPSRLELCLAVLAVVAAVFLLYGWDVATDYAIAQREKQSFLRSHCREVVCVHGVIILQLM